MKGRRSDACTLATAPQGHMLRRACRFETVYLDDDLRIAKDIRGDTLIVENGGPATKFT